MIKVDGRRLTPNQMAKVLVARYGEGAYYWMEKVDVRGITDAEHDEITKRVEHHMKRMEKFLLGESLRTVWF